MSSRDILIILVFSAALSWLGFGYLVSSTAPEAINRWFFFPLLFLGVLTTVTPVAYYLNLRFAEPESGHEVMLRSLRHGGLAALFFVLCTWLQMVRALNWITALLLLWVLVLVEVFIMLRET